jgi:CHAT domain-containing protein
LLDSKSGELRETADLPRRAAYALARTGSKDNRQKAVETLERGRARGLSENLDRDRADLTQLQQTHPDLYGQYQDVALQLRSLESQQRDLSTSEQRHSLTPTELRDTAAALHDQLTQALSQIRQVDGYTEFLAQTSFKDIRAALSPAQPLVYLVTTPNGSMALIVTVNATNVLWLNDLTETKLLDLLSQTWVAAYGQSQIDCQSWYSAITSTTRQLWHSLMGPLIQKLQSLNLTQATLIPTGYLGLLPLHAAWTEDPSTSTGRRYALDDISITYAPNARSLTAARAISDRVQAHSILAIVNPRRDLPNSEREVQAAISTFPQSTMLCYDQATVDQVRSQLPNATIAHFSCHGTANLQDPLNSGLLMSDGLLTLKDIFALNLAEIGGLRLAVLSACETGVQGIENADEAISLPTGLLKAGVAAVIASLWSVSDLSTMILLTRFYDFWRFDNLAPDSALRLAQQWVRDTTNGEKVDYYKNLFLSKTSSQTPSQIADFLYKELIFSHPEARDFSHPFH